MSTVGAPVSEYIGAASGAATVPGAVPKVDHPGAGAVVAKVDQFVDSVVASTVDKVVDSVVA